METQEARAWTYTGGYPDTLKLSTINPPTTASFKENADTSRLLVKVHACALNPVDIQMMNLPSWRLPWNALYGVEKGAVCDFSGTVLASGGDKFKEGDEVFGLTLRPFAPNGGTLGEIVDLNMNNCAIAKKPAIWSFEKAAAISLVWLTARTCIESVAEFVEKSEGKKVAILGGSSATGAYSAMLAKQRGWTVATTSSGRNKDFVLNTLGADQHVDYTSDNVRSTMTKFAPAAVIDCVGGTECIGLPSSKRYTSIVGDKTGRTSMGGPYTYYDYLAPFNATRQWLRWLNGQYGFGESYDTIILDLKSEWLEEATKTLPADDIHVDSVWSFEDAKKGFEKLNTGRARGKVVVKVAK